MRHRPALAACLLALLAGPPPVAHAADPILPLADVRSGMRCTGLSVVRGTTISEFDVEVVDVVRGSDLSFGPRILVRASGPTIEPGGIGSGFSGSPILCRGEDGVARNAGAISETVGEFGSKLVLVTPIEAMLGDRPRAPRGARSAPAMHRRARAIATPLTVTGLSGRVGRRLQRAARRAGVSLIAAPAGPLGGFPTQALRPGSAIAASFATGDVSFSAIGTVTYRDGPALWAFGHPFEGFGRRALPLQDAYVYAVVNNPVSSDFAFTYKFAAPGHTVGALTNDTANAIVGRVGPPPDTIPLRVRVRDRDTGRTETVRTRVSDERHLELGSGLDLVSNVALAQALDGTLGSGPPRVTSTMCVRIALRGRPRPLGFCNHYVDSGPPFADLSTAVTLIDNFKFGRLEPRRVSVRMGISRGVDEAFLIRARAPRHVRAGENARIRLLLRARRGPIFRRSVAFPVPRSARTGKRTLTLRGVVPLSLRRSEEAFRLEFGDFGFGPSERIGPRSVDALAGEVAAIRRRDGLRASLVPKRRGRIILPTRRLMVRGTAKLGVRVLPPR